MKDGGQHLLNEKWHLTAVTAIEDFLNKMEYM